MVINVYDIVRHSFGSDTSVHQASQYHLVKKCTGPPSAPKALCTDALSGDANLWRWIDAAPCVDLNQARSSPSPPDCEDEDIHGSTHGCDALTAAVDFDAWGNEILEDLPSDDDPDQD
jgi:hypothetical protein